MAKKKTATLRIQWVRSFIGCPEGMRQTIRGLGLRRLQHVVERPDTPAIRGMILKVEHLVKVEELDDGRTARRAAGTDEKSN